MTQPTTRRPSHQVAKQIANDHLRADGSSLRAGTARWDRKHGVWVVAYRDPEHPSAMLIGGALVVTVENTCHAIGSTPDAVDRLMTDMGRWPRSESRPTRNTDHEALALLADIDPDEARELNSYASSLQPWPEVLSEEWGKPYYRDLRRFIQTERRRTAVYPEQNLVFAALHLTPLDKVKVVLIGQDPYPTPGEATGLAFSVPKGTKPPKSLVNIFEAMRRDGLTPPSDGDFSHWAREGVLLLNLALTLPATGEPKNHLPAWRPFVETILRKIDSRPEPVVFVLWGTKAQEIKRWGVVNFERHGLVEAPHPAARAEQEDFRNARTFSRANELLKQLGHRPIDWSGEEA